MAAGSLIYMDVRSRQELETDGAIVGSYVVPTPELDQAFQLDDAAFLAKYCFPKPAKDATDVVVACKSGRRALAAINKLRAVGYDGLRIYPGSFNDWKMRGGPLTFEIVTC